MTEKSLEKHKLPVAEAEKLLELLKYRVETVGTRGRKYYNSSNQLHREEGPAVILESGSRAWYQNGKLHRLEGPAITWYTGELEYWQDGQQHRLDGPAVILKDYLGWFIQGREYSRAEFIEQQRNAGILLPALKDSYWFSQIPRVSKGLI